MEDYGKRRIPRNAGEFEDLIFPILIKDPAHTISILTSYSKRKKRNPLKDFETMPFLLYLSFKKGTYLSFETLCSYFNVYHPEIPLEIESEVFANCELSFKRKFPNAQEFLRKFIYSFRIRNTQIEKKFHPIKQLSNYVSEYGTYSRPWIYGVNNNRNDICGVYLIRVELSDIVNEAHQEVRNLKGLAPILSRWKSEQMLFDQIKIAFPELVVIGQGSPEWLEGQRFDVWLPQLSLAIEFNGIQHFQAVDYFGGDEGFRKTKERDEMKREKCKSNNTALIEVQEGFDFEILRLEIEEIKKSISNELFELRSASNL